MTDKEINEKALQLLLTQDWKNAQALFFENAKKNSSHQTYNNLGYYLITEGLECKNGSCRNAHSLGMKYLLKAAELKDTVVNLCAIVTALDCELLTASKKRKKEICCEACSLLEKALHIEYSDELEYNFLRFLYLLDSDNMDIIARAKSLLKTFLSTESVLLYFELLRIHLLKEDGLRYIEKYSEFLDEASMLIFYADLGLYEFGYKLCESVYHNFDIDKVLAASIIECCVKTEHFNEAKTYAEKIRENEDEIRYQGKEDWVDKVFENITSGTEYRKKLISNYRFTPAFVGACCYFGCKNHGIVW